MRYPWIGFLVLLTTTGGNFDQFSRNVDFLHRMITEGLSEDKTTTDVLFINFKLPKFVDIFDVLLQRLRQSTMISTLIDARAPHSRTRQIIVVAALDQPNLAFHYMRHFSRSSVTARDQLENSLNKHIIVVTTNTDDLRSIISITFACFKTFNFIIFVYYNKVGHVITLGRGRYPRIFGLNVAFNTMLAKRRFESHPMPYRFGAILRAPWVEKHEDRFEGLDVTVFDTIMKHMGQAFIIIVIETTGNVTATADTIDALFLKDQMSAYINRHGFASDWAVEMMIPHTNGLCLLVPKTQTRYLFHHLLQPYETSSWIFFCSFLIILGAISYIWNKLFHQNLILTLFCGSRYSHQRMQRFERFLVVGSSCLLTVLFEAYLVKFITHMTTYRYVRDPVTIDEFIKSPGKLLIHELTLNETLEVRSDLEPKLVAVPSMAYDITNLTYGYITKCSQAKSMLARQAEEDRQTFGRNVRPMFHVIPEKLEVYRSQYTFDIDFMGYAYFELYYSWLFDSGLIDYWEKSAEQRVSVAPGYRFADSAVLDLGRLQLVWVVYGIGIAVSSVMLLLELIVRFVVAWSTAEIILRLVGLF